jgi:UDP-N-acetylglucosamine diphosphorylase/glucosamine-1-phosphate N-acetyltransferase
MKRWLLIYEDSRWRLLRPLTDLAPLPALAFGSSTVAERWRRAAGMPLLTIEARKSALAAWSDAPRSEIAAARAGDEVLVVNAAALPGPWFDLVLASDAPTLLMGDGRVAGACLSFESISPALGRGEGFEAELLAAGPEGRPVDAQFITYPWELIEANADAIAEDLSSMAPEIRGSLHRFAALEGTDRIRVEAGAVIEAFACLDARGGPVWIGPGARVAAHTVVTGPCVVGPGTQLLGGSVMRCTIGPQCRIAGEVEESVWQGYANKRHHGFVGHSALGEWVNLGALTTTSDLKNNYGTVRVWVDGADVESGRTKVGALIGAHVKTGIGTLLPTGASVGTGSNVFGGGRYAPRRVPPFGWWDGDRMVEHELERFLATARAVTSRRGRALLPADEALLRATFDATSGERTR